MPRQSWNYIAYPFLMVDRIRPLTYLRPAVFAIPAHQYCCRKAVDWLPELSYHAPPHTAAAHPVGPWGTVPGMLFAQGDYETAEEVWMQARSDDMMALNLPLIKAVLKSLLPYTATAGAASVLSVLFMATNPYLSAAALAGATSKLVGAGAVASAGLGIKEVLPHLGLFTRERLNDIIQGAVDPIGITTTDKRVYTALTALSGMHLPNRSVSTADSTVPLLRPIGEIEYRSWKSLTYDEIVETVLASAALPGVYPASAYKKKVYIDGGVLDNSPVKPLIDAGFQHIIIVHLDYLKKMEDRRKKESMILSQGDSMIHFMHIWPSSPAIGETLEIGSGLTRRRINLGYADTENQLLPLLNRDRLNAYEHLLQLMPQLGRIKDAETHYNLASEIYKQSIRSAVLSGDRKRLLAFLQTEKGMAMLRNYEYAADLGHEQAKKMVQQIHKIEESEQTK